MAITLPRQFVPGSNEVAPKNDIALIGGGVVALIIAYYLLKNGFEVSVFEKNSDPRAIDPDSEENFGASYSGGNARIFSYNEARHHNFGRHCKDTKLNTQFRRYFFEGGWMGTTLNTLSRADKKWIKNFEAITEHEGATYDRDIISFNKESSPLWRAMKQDLPTIFQEGGLCFLRKTSSATKGLLRLIKA